MSATDDHRRHAWIAYVLEEVGKDELGELALGVFTVHIGEWPEPPGESTRDHPDAPVDGLGLDDALLWARTRAARVWVITAGAHDTPYTAGEIPTEHEPLENALPILRSRARLGARRPAGPGRVHRVGRSP